MKGSQLAPPQSASVAHGNPQLQRQNPRLCGPAAVTVCVAVAGAGSRAGEFTVFRVRSGRRYVFMAGEMLVDRLVEVGVEAMATAAATRTHRMTSVFRMHSSFH